MKTKKNRPIVKTKQLINKSTKQTKKDKRNLFLAKYFILSSLYIFFRRRKEKNRTEKGKKLVLSEIGLKDV